MSDESVKYWAKVLAHAILLAFVIGLFYTIDDALATALGLPGLGMIEPPVLIIAAFVVRLFKGFLSDKVVK